MRELIDHQQDFLVADASDVFPRLEHEPLEIKEVIDLEILEIVYDVIVEIIVLEIVQELYLDALVEIVLACYV